MLDNDPPEGTRVRLVRDVTKGLRTLRSNEVAMMIGSLKKYHIERPEDEFAILYAGERVVVQRRDIVKA